jgi:hypothetical protein
MLKKLRKYYSAVSAPAIRGDFSFCWVDLFQLAGGRAKLEHRCQQGNASLHWRASGPSADSFFIGPDRVAFEYMASSKVHS